MRPYAKLLMASAAFLALAGAPAMAETVKTTTVVTQKDIPDVKKTDFMAFDLNGDRILSMPEVGEKLFYVFDTDGNEVIDNIEFDNKQVMTIIPMEKQTFTFIDYNNDGSTDQATYSYDTFIEKSGLMRFDNNMNGLSPAEFIQMSFLEADDNHSKVIELDEWKKAYTEMTHYPNAEQDKYNQ